MTTREVAEFLGIAEPTVRRQILNGKMAATKVGRQWWVTQSAMMDYQIDSLGQPGRKKTRRRKG